VQPRLFVVLAAVLWGTTGTAQALAPDAATPLGVGTVRLLLGAASLLLAARAVTWGRPVAVGGACVAAYQLAFFAAVDRTGVAAGTIVAIGSAPVLAGALGWLVRRERPSRRWWPATALAVCGGALLVAGGGDDVRLDAAGMVLAVGAGLAYAGYTVAAKGLLDVHPPLVVMASLFGTGALLLVPLLALESFGWVAEPAGAVAAVHLGVLTVAAAYVLFGLGLRGVQVATAGTLTLAEPLTAGLLGVAVLDESLSPLAWGGVAVVVAGLVLLAIPPARRGAAPRRDPR
jgi:DME family drug/metabolite transporter